jgi:glyoxylate reductase
MKVFVTRRIPEPGLERLREAGEVTVWPEDLPPPAEALRRGIADADALLSLLTDRIGAEMIAAGPRLRVIANYAVGYDNIDVAAATERGILVTNTPGVLTETTADLAWALMMAAARHIVAADRYTRAGRWRTWEPMLFLGHDIHGATLGLIGCGRIGAAVARRAQGFQMRVICHDPHCQETQRPCQPEIACAELDEVFRESDFISIHVPLTERTRHLIGAEQFARMKPTAVLVNTARGPVVDQQALHHALASGEIAAAGLDVFETEPIAADDPLLALDNVVVVPHIGSASVATRTKMATMAADSIVAALRGETPPNLVNPEALDGR